jgi:ABC-type Na+ efflux pump permease subunit
MSAEFLGGAAGTVLGILALLGVASVTLTSIAVIVYGAALLFGSGARARMSTLPVEEGPPSAAHQVVREAAWASSGPRLLVGVGAAVLGILALVGFAPSILILSALLTVGAALALSGAAFTTTRMMQQRIQH